MSTFTIDNTLQNIIYNGFAIQRLIFNGSLVWERGSQPTPQPAALIDPYETVPNRSSSSQSNTWNYNCTQTYNQFNFIDTQLCTAQELLDYDYGNARIIKLRCQSGNAKKIYAIDYIKISEWLTSDQAQSLYSAIDNASNPSTWSSSLESTIREWYKSQRTTASNWYYTQIRDAWFVVANIMIYNDNVSTPDIKIAASDGSQYNIDDSTASNLGTTYKIKLNYDTTTSNGVYYPSVPNSSVGLAASPFVLLTSWTSLFKMLYNEYYLKNQSFTFYTITVQSNDLTKGTVSGGGECAENRNCTVTATKTGDAYKFSAWYENGQIVSTDAEYTFIVTRNRTLEARFIDVTTYTVSVTVDPTMGTVSGAGQYYEGTTATLTATKNTGYRFTGWYQNGNLLSTSETYSFTVNSNVTLTAEFEESATEYTEVAWIGTTTTALSYSGYYINTGITTTIDNYEIRMKYIPLADDGNIYFGNMGCPINGTQKDSNDFRIFYYGSRIYCDVSSSRSNVNGGGYNQDIDYTWNITLTGTSNAAVTVVNNNTGNSILSFTTSSRNWNENPFYICLPKMRFKGLTIKKNGTTVFDGIPALDSNNILCVYDKVTDTCIAINAASYGYLTYQSL